MDKWFIVYDNKTTGVGTKRVVGKIALKESSEKLHPKVEDMKTENAGSEEVEADIQPKFRAESVQVERQETGERRVERSLNFERADNSLSQAKKDHAIKGKGLMVEDEEWANRDEKLLRPNFESG